MWIILGICNRTMTNFLKNVRKLRASFFFIHGYFIYIHQWHNDETDEHAFWNFYKFVNYHLRNIHRNHGICLLQILFYIFILNNILNIINSLIESPKLRAWNVFSTYFWLFYFFLRVFNFIAKNSKMITIKRPPTIVGKGII